MIPSVLQSIFRNMAKSVCIVGAGPSGLVAAKTLLHNSKPGEFKVTVFDTKDAIGGLWPLSPEDTKRQVHPLMVANQSRHTMHFSDQAWEASDPQIPQAWQVGKYLENYQERYLAGNEGYELRLGTRVERAERAEKGWDISIRSEQREETRRFDYLLVASGFFGKPIVPESLSKEQKIPVIHSSEYRDLKGLLGKGRAGGGKILVVGGQMSGVEIAGTIGSHISSAIHSPDAPSIPDVEKYTIQHVIQRPIWVFPLYTSPKPTTPAAPFLPFDFGSYNLNNRPKPLKNTQGHITEETAQTVHGIFRTVLGTDQSEFSPLLKIDDTNNKDQPYLACSDWYNDLVRSGLIQLSKGKVEALSGNVATLSGGEKIEDLAAVVVATGFDASPCIDFLPSDVLKTLHHAPQHIDQPVALAFHGTHHPDVSNLGFVGFYRSPYWGVMQMQARFLATQWASGERSAAFLRKLQEDDSIERTVKLQDDPRCSQFPMGDYPWLMSEFSEALGIEMQSLPTDDLPKLPHNDLPLDMLTPSRYSAPNDDKAGKEAAMTSLEDTRKITVDGLTTPRFVARAVFRSLLGTWKLERDLKSKLPTHPSGHFSGTAKFLLREKTTDGLRCATNPTSLPAPDEHGMEYLYIEEGEFKTEQGFGFTASRRYIWRYDESRDVVSVWFAKPEDVKRADYLFHEIEFEGASERGWKAKAGHLCIDDYYNVGYEFAFRAVNLRQWGIEYTVKGPRKDYTIRGTYTR